MADTQTSVTASDGGGLKDLGDMCETVRHRAQEAQYAARDGDDRAAAEFIEQLLDEEARLRLAYRQWLARGLRVSDSRMSV